MSPESVQGVPLPHVRVEGTNKLKTMNPTCYNSTTRIYSSYMVFGDVCPLQNLLGQFYQPKKHKVYNSLVLDKPH